MNYKKRVPFFVLILILILCSANVLSVFGYSNDTFEITVPDNYALYSSSNTMWRSQDGYSSIEVIVANNANNFNVLNLDKDDLKDFQDSCTSSYDSQVKKTYGENCSATFNYVDTTFQIVNGYKAICVDMEITYTINDNSFSTHRYSYTLASLNYVYAVTLTMFEDDDVEYASGISSIKSFVMKDTLFEGRTQKDESSLSDLFGNSYLIVFVAGGIFLGAAIGVLLAYLEKRKKRRS